MAGFRQHLGESFGAIAAVFRNADLRRVELAWTITMLAQWGYFVALAVYAYGRGGATAVGLVTIIRVIPSAIASPLLSVLADRYRRDLVLVLATAARALLIAAAALFVIADLHEFLVYGCAALMSVAGTVIRPSQSAMLPSLARTPGELTAANVTTSTIESVGQFIGPAVGGLLLAATGTEVVFFAVAGAFALSALLVSRLETLQERPTPVEDERTGFLHEATAGMRAIGAERRLRALVALSGTQTMVAGAFSVLIVAAALDLLDLGEVGVGYLNSAVGIGGLAGAILALGLAGRNRLASNFGAGMFLWGVPIVLIGIYPESAVAIALLIVIGAGNTIVDVAGLTLMQRAVRDEVLGRVFGALEGLMIITVGLGAMLAPLLIELIGIRGALMVTGALLPVLTALFWRSLAGIDRTFEAPAEDRLELLRRIPIFAPLPAATLEYLVGALVEHRRSAGDVIFRQGDHGDRYYVVADGRVEVEVDGRSAGILLPGQGFGEIALLRDVPRTGTVTALTDVTLVSVARDQFIGAVTGHAPSAAAAEAVVSTRLDRLSPRIATV